MLDHNKDFEYGFALLAKHKFVWTLVTNGYFQKLLIA